MNGAFPVFQRAISDEKEIIGSRVVLGDNACCGSSDGFIKFFCVRFRNDHYIKHDKNTNEKTGTVRANMIHVQVNSTYKINDNWQAHLDMGYRNSFSGFDERQNLAFSDNSENDTGFKMDTYLTGKMFNDSLALKIGKWNEWNPFGWGMDIDCDFAGAQLVYGKKDFKTFFTAGKMDLWDNFMGGYTRRTRKHYESRYKKCRITSGETYKKLTR